MTKVKKRSGIKLESLPIMNMEKALQNREPTTIRFAPNRVAIAPPDQGEKEVSEEDASAE
jgi:hypothetical protein